MRSSIPPVHVEAGILRWEALRSERHEWVATFGWAPADGEGPTRFDLRLGESIHIDGMGAVTLLEVEPAALSGSNVPGGPPGAVVNISFAPGSLSADSGNSVKISLLGGFCFPSGR